MRNIKRDNFILVKLSKGAAIAALLIGMVMPGLASAASAPGSASGLSISPLRQQLTLSPGQYSQINVTLKNITGGPVNAVATIRNFVSDNVDGNPKITDAATPASIKSFLLNVNKVSLATGEQKTFTIAVHVPAGTAPGAYYGLIEYQAIPTNNGSQPGGTSKVALTAAVSQLVFITVPGNITELMQIKSINVYHDKLGTLAGDVFTSPPKSVGINLANLANDFEQPYGTVQIQNMSGKVVDSYQVNNGITRGLVLPNSDRVFINPVSKISSPGTYTITASITYGKGGSAILVAKKTFLYIPVWLILIILLIILILIGIVYWLYRRFRHARATRYRG